MAETRSNAGGSSGLDSRRFEGGKESAFPSLALLHNKTEIARGVLERQKVQGRAGSSAAEESGCFVSPCADITTGVIDPSEIPGTLTAALPLRDEIQVKRLQSALCISKVEQHDAIDNFTH